MTEPPSRSMNTRAANKMRHPGMPDKPAPKRSSRAVQSEHAARKATAMETQKRQQKNIQAAAAIENDLQKELAEQHAAFHNTTSRVLKRQPAYLSLPDYVPVDKPRSAITGRGARVTASRHLGCQGKCFVSYMQ